VVAALALVALGLRAFPLLGSGGALGHPIDYDEGVYFSAAAYLLEGAWPYRDFVFVHPPGQLLFLALTSAWAKGWLGVGGAFALSRLVAVLLGVVTTVLVARVASRWSPWAGVFAAAVYATYPEIAQVERGPFIEPLLNLLCVVGALLVLRACEVPGRGRIAAAGVLGGVALAVKVWAGLWLLAGAWALVAAVSRPGAAGEGRAVTPARALTWYLGAAAATALALVLPFALRAPSEFLTQVVLFHAWRPPDGLTSRLARVEQLVSVRHLASPLFALGVLGLCATRRAWSPVARLAGAAWGLTVVAFFASAAWWSQYNAHLVLSEALLAAGVLTFGPRRPGSPPLGSEPGPAKPPLGLVLVGVVSLALSLGHSIRRGFVDPPAQSPGARSLLQGAERCAFAFEPGLALAAGRLPSRATGPLVDSYAHQLLGVLRDGRRFPDAQAAFDASEVPAALRACDVVLPSDRQRRQVADEKLSVTHELVGDDAGRAWRRRGAP
jgi:hypothetical protein